MVPSKMPSAKPAIVVIGVFSSWETLATNSLRFCSAWARESAMALKAMASSPISSSRLAYSVTRVSTSPWANLWAKAHMPLSGSTMRWTVMEQMMREMSSTTMAVMRKSCSVLCKNSDTLVASAATKRKPVAIPEGTRSAGSLGSWVRGERTSLVR